MQLFTHLDSHVATADDVDTAQGSAPFFACNCLACGAGGNTALDAGQGGFTPGTTAYPVSSAGNAAGADAAALLSGMQWTGRDASGKTVITYSFSTPASQFDGDSAQFSSSLLAFSAADQATTRAMLGTISAVCNVTFVEVADNGAQAGQIRYAYSQGPNDMGFAGYAFFPSNDAIGGDVWIGKNQASSQWDYYRADLILHETLHAIGLKHPFDGGVTLGAQNDIIANTVMSYSPVAGNKSGSLSAYPTEPMALDVQALQSLYGAASNNAGDTAYNLADASFRTSFRALWDSAGIDTLDASRVGSAVLLDLHAGARSDIGAQVKSYAYTGNNTWDTGVYTSTLALTNGTQIENAVGTAYADTLLGNALDNMLIGAGGDDWLDGGAGTDTAGYNGSIANFKIEKVGNNIQVTDRQSGQGTDILSNVEKVRFQDLSVDLTVQDAAAAVSGARLKAVVELYVGFFNRVPDAEGLNYWLGQMNQGMTTAKVADAFYNSALEFSHLTGYSSGMTNEDFVKVIYKNVLGRSDPDAEGLAYWSKSLANGTESRGSLLDSILNSAHSFEGNATYGWVADLLDNKYEVGKVFAVDMGLTYNTSEQSITKGMQIAAAVTATDTHAALELIGVATHDLSIGF